MMDLSFHRKVTEGSEYLDESDDGIVFKKLSIFISDRIHDKIKTIKNKKKFIGIGNMSKSPTKFPSVMSKN